MTIQKFIRFSGIALLVAGISTLLWWLGLAVFIPLEGIETGYLNLVKDGDWLWVNIIGLVATMLLPVGFFGLYLKQAKESGKLGFIGFLCAFFGSLLFMCVQYIETILWPIFTEHASGLLEHKGAMFTNTTFNTFYMLMGVLLALGFIIIGISTMLSRVLPKWGALFMLIGGTAFSVAISIVIIRTIGIILLTVGLVWLGYAIWRDSDPGIAEVADAKKRLAGLKSQ
jgi:hypothetical protein